MSSHFHPNEARFFPSRVAGTSGEVYGLQSSSRCDPDFPVEFQYPVRWPDIWVSYRDPCVRDCPMRVVSAG